MGPFQDVPDEHASNTSSNAPLEDEREQKDASKQGTMKRFSLPVISRFPSFLQAQGQLAGKLRIWWQKRKVKVTQRQAKRVENWQSWSRFKRWRRSRPFAGSILLILAGILVLIGPLSLVALAFLGNMIWAGLLVGGLLLVMGLIQLFAPYYSLITGSVGIVLSLVSFVVAVGGFGIGMILGIIGGALGVAWRPVARHSGNAAGQAALARRKVSS